MTTEIPGDFPFSELPDEEVLGTGYESIIRKLGPNWVYKEVNPLDFRGNPKSPENIEKARSKETVLKNIEEQKILENIFGGDHFEKSYYVYGENPQGEKEYMLVQRYIPGKNIEELTKGDNKKYESLEQLVTEFREQFKDIVWAAKRAFLEFGVPPDISLENFMKNDSNGNIILMDYGTPARDYEQFANTESSVKMPEERVEGFFKRVNRINELESYLKLSDDERDFLDKKYDVSSDIVAEKTEQLIKFEENRQAAKIEKRKQEVAAFLDIAFEDNDTITGKEISDKALQEMADREIPKQTQQVLDKLIEQKEINGNKDYWLEQISQWWS